MLMCMRGVQDRIKRDLRLAQQLAYSSAILNTFAVNNPKKMPSFAEAFPDGSKKQAMTPDQMMTAMERWTVRIAAQKQG